MCQAAGKMFPFLEQLLVHIYIRLCNMMSQSPSKESGRRLSNEAVRSIFESIHNGNLPPPHLNFKIISAGPNGMTLSPPSYEFESKYKKKDTNM